MFKVNNKDAKRRFSTYFTFCSSVSFVNFEHVIASWVSLKFTGNLTKQTHTYSSC